MFRELADPRATGRICVAVPYRLPLLDAQPYQDRTACEAVS